MSEMKIGFELRKIRLALENILPMRLVKAEEKATYRFKAIIGSIPDVGLVEPLVVYPQKDAPGKYMLKNGHLRYFALIDLGKTEADCLIATDDECYTYNARISRLPPIQEHKMIVKAVNNGVSPERLTEQVSTKTHCSGGCARVPCVNQNATATVGGFLAPKRLPKWKISPNLKFPHQKRPVFCTTPRRFSPQSKG
jgi:hypothetical protein